MRKRPTPHLQRKRNAYSRRRAAGIKLTWTIIWTGYDPEPQRSVMDTIHATPPLNLTDAMEQAKRDTRTPLQMLHDLIDDTDTHQNP